MFEDENEKWVNPSENFTPAAPAEPQVSPTETAAPVTPSYEIPSVPAFEAPAAPPAPASFDFDAPAAPPVPSYHEAPQFGEDIQSVMKETTESGDQLNHIPEDFSSIKDSDSFDDNSFNFDSAAPFEETSAPAPEPVIPQAPVAPQPVYQAPATPQPTYQTPVASQPVYQAPVTPQATTYRESPYSPYSERAYTNNTYTQPMTPSYNPPVPPTAPPQQNNPEEKPKKKKAGKIILALVAIFLVFAIGFGSAAYLLSKSRRANNNSAKTETGTQVAGGTGDDKQLDIQPAPSSEVSTTAEIAEKARLSNVGILIYTNSSSSSVSGEGSGVVMDVDSTGEYTYIITCAHVIDTQGAIVKVQTEDGTVYDAEVVGYDTRTDLGVVRVHATCFTPAEFGDSDELAVGDPVYAIGNPGGVEFFGTFTGGYVSAINRPISSEIGYTMKCIQHDASINPGNSGGMLVNKYGQVIGINSQKIAATNYEGMGFAIPISDAKSIVENLITYGYVPNRPKLGITYYPTSSITQYAIIAQVNNLPTGSLVIATINSDSAFTGTDVRKGDMIIAVNGKDMDTADVLLETIDGGKVGDKLTLTIARIESNYSVSTFDVTVTLIEDRGTEVQEETTQSYNPYSYFGY